ncbi:unnamed protein product, partial [Linum tenue]
MTMSFLDQKVKQKRKVTKYKLWTRCLKSWASPNSWLGFSAISQVITECSEIQ